MLTGLVSLGVLLTSLRPPMTVIDALGYVVDHLTTVDGDGIPELADQIQNLRAIHSAVNRHNSARSPSVRHQVRTDATRRMSALCDRVEQPLVVNMRVDGTLVLPEKIAREAERAASTLLRLTSRPLGAPAWQAYHARFLDRYGVGGLVAVLDLVNEDTGLGFPAGYRGSLLTSSPASLTARDHRLLKLAQHAVMAGSREVVLDDRTIDEIAVDAQTDARMPPHFELCCQIHAPTRQALDRGEFQIAVVGAARAAGTTTGRFLHLLDTSDRDRMADVYAGLPTAEAGAWPVQISCPPLSRRTDNVARVSAVLPDIVSLGECRPPDGSAIPFEDLVVGADAQRLYLMSLTRQRIVEPTVLHAVEFRNHTHPMARFLSEITTAQSAACLPFSWGAASTLPFLPRVRYGRIVLASARWNIDPSDVPPLDTPWSQWNRVFSQLRHRLRIPDVVVLGGDDRRIRLDVSVPLHRALLRSELERTGRAILHEAPDPGVFGWCDGRSHEVVLPLARPAPTVRSSRRARVLRTVSRDHGHLPGASEWLFVKVYGGPNRQTAVLTTHLPYLLEMWNEPPEWWYVRYRDPEPHLRLRLRLAGCDAQTFGDAVQRVGTWASDLRRAGLLTRLQFDTYFPETGRFGTGAAMEAVESVFVADSTAAVEELRYAANGEVHPQALVAVSLVDIAVGFHDSVSQGMSWLISEVKGSHPAPRREVHDQARRLVDPDNGWAATLRATPAGDLIEAAWRSRREMLAAYRDWMTVTGDLDAASVLPALLHLHHLRVVGGDPKSEQICQRIARALALSWQARTSRVTS
jgi:thiopeptide-type bacteriocin biosynthesis protein